MKYATAADWFNEVEGFALRSERFYADFAHLEANDLNRIVQWCHAAFEAAAQPPPSASVQVTPTPGWMTEEHIMASPETKMIDRDGARWLGCVYGDDDDWRIYAVPIRTTADQPTARVEE